MSCKCKPIIINCCDCGGEGTETGGANAPYIGENGNWFTWDGEQWVDSGVAAQGSGGGDMYASVYDPQGKATDIFTYVDDAIETALAVIGETTDMLAARLAGAL